MILLVLWTIRQQSCTWEQICTCKSFGIYGQIFRRYRFVPGYRIVGVWFTKPDVLCLRWGKWHTGQPLLRSESTQVIWWVRQSHKLLYLAKENTDFSYNNYIGQRYNNTSTTLYPYSESTLGPAGCLRHFGIALSYCNRLSSPRSHLRLQSLKIVRERIYSTARFLYGDLEILKTVMNLSEISRTAISPDFASYFK